LQAVIDRIEDLRSVLEELRDEEQEYMDNMPENLWGSERYNKAEEAISDMDFALDNLEQAVSYIESAQE